MKQPRMLLILALFAAGISCKQTVTKSNEENVPLIIALSKGSGSKNYLLYERWIRQAMPETKCIDLNRFPASQAVVVLEYCDGLVMTGGADVNPARYNSAEDSIVCVTDNPRDTLEYALIDRARIIGIPVLGICRGMQILNTAYGGTLIPDIPRDRGKKLLHRNTDADTCTHIISCSENVFGRKYRESLSYRVNSYHHQAVENTSVAFRILARSSDGIPEIMSWREPGGKPFLLAVQFHPERAGCDRRLSARIRNAFMNAVIFYRSNRIRRLFFS